MVLLVELIGKSNFIGNLFPIYTGKDVILFPQPAYGIRTLGAVPYAGWLELDDMDRADVGVLEGGLENFGGRKGIEVQDGQRFAVAIAAA